MVSKALPVKHPRASDSQRLTSKHSAGVRMHKEHCGFPSRSVLVVYMFNATVDFLTNLLNNCAMFLRVCCWLFLKAIFSLASSKVAEEFRFRLLTVDIKPSGSS